MNFSRFRYGDIQSWWEVPSIAYFCSLFRTAFNLLDFDIEELEEALLTDGTEESASSLLTELIVRLLNGCLGNNDISAFNYQMYLRRLFRQKCQETGRYNPFNTDIDFQFLPLRTKVEILYALCDFRLDAEDVFDLFRNLEAESLRVEPLGWDDNYSAYWYFYGTRLYREDVLRKPKGKNKRKKVKESKKRSGFPGDGWLNEEDSERVWQVVCFTEEDWTHLTEKFSRATSKIEKELYRSLSQNFLPEIPRLFQEKERLQRKRTVLDQTSHAQEQNRARMGWNDEWESARWSPQGADEIAEDLYNEVGLACNLMSDTKNRHDDAREQRHMKRHVKHNTSRRLKPKSKHSRHLSLNTIQELFNAGPSPFNKIKRNHQNTKTKTAHRSIQYTKPRNLHGSMQYIQDNIIRALQCISKTWHSTEHVKKTTLKDKLHMMQMRKNIESKTETVKLCIQDNSLGVNNKSGPEQYLLPFNAERDDGLPLMSNDIKTSKEFAPDGKPGDYSFQEVGNAENMRFNIKADHKMISNNAKEAEHAEDEMCVVNTETECCTTSYINEVTEQAQDLRANAGGKCCMTLNIEEESVHMQNFSATTEVEHCSTPNNEAVTEHAPDLSANKEVENYDEFENSPDTTKYQLDFTQLSLSCSIWLFDMNE